VFTYHPNNITTSAYSDISLSCEAVGFEIVTITWERVDLEVPSVATQSDTKLGDTITSILHMTRTNGYFTGQYYCIAVNSAGKVKSKVAVLRVTGKNHEFVQMCLKTRYNMVKF